MNIKNSQPTNGAEPHSQAAPVIERAPLPMLEVEGKNHVVCYVNAAFCHLLRKRRDELIGKPFAEIVVNGDKCVPLLDRVYKTGEFEAHSEPDEEEPAHWLFAMWPALNADQQPVRVIVQLTKSVRFRHDLAVMNEALLIGGLRQHGLRETAEKAIRQMELEIAERRRVETELREAQSKLRLHTTELEETVANRTAQLRASLGELEAFAYSLAHDLRAPVRAIRGFTELVLEMPPAAVAPEAAHHLQRVVKAAARMDSLIQDVLMLSDVIRRPIQMGPVDLEVLVGDLINERPELSSPGAAIKIEHPLHPVLGHEATLSQCLTNLLSNAVKFVEPGAVAQVRVWTERLPSSEPARAAEPGSQVSPPSAPARVRLWVEDQGIGIPAKAHQIIFEIFQRQHNNAKYEGSGIGLAIVRKAAERMNGRVGVQSEPGKGSRFWLELPAVG
jgi:signal transduction histidine kinase